MKLGRRGRQLALAALLLFGTIGLIVGAITLYHQVSYRTVAADIMAVDEQCVLELKEGKRTYSEGPLPCPEARELHDHGGFGGYRVMTVAVIHVRYLSPADDQSHESSFLSRNLTYLGRRPGDTIDVRAHVSRPEQLLEAGGL